MEFFACMQKTWKKNAWFWKWNCCALLEHSKDQHEYHVLVFKDFLHEVTQVYDFYFSLKLCGATILSLDRLSSTMFSFTFVFWIMGMRTGRSEC